jgi:hypothetical protein
MFSHYTSDEAIHYGLSALPDELQELHIEAASLEVNPLLRTQAGKVRPCSSLLPTFLYREVSELKPERTFVDALYRLALAGAHVCVSLKTAEGEEGSSPCSEGASSLLLLTLLLFTYECRCIPYWTITSIPTSCRPRPDWCASLALSSYRFGGARREDADRTTSVFSLPLVTAAISKTVRIKFLKRIQILVARVELDKLGRDISAVPVRPVLLPFL